MGINGPPLGYTLDVYYDDNFSINGSAPNACLQALLGEKMGHTWCGNILALRSTYVFGVASYDYKDVDWEKDMAPLIKYFEEYGKVFPKQL
jgi:hypothetical protein